MTVTENLYMGAFANRKNIQERIEKIFQIFPRLFERKDYLDINKSGVSILIVEQDVQMVLEMSQRAFVMEVGSITLSGKSSELINDPKIK